MSVQLVPFCVSIRPQVLPLVSLYQPTVTQPLATGQTVEAVYTWGSVDPVPASVGSGAWTVAQPWAGAVTAPAGAEAIAPKRPSSRTAAMEASEPAVSQRANRGRARSVGMGPPR